MLEFINSPIFLSVFFPLLSVLGMPALLRWAVGENKKTVCASFGVGLACLVTAVCAFGRIEEPFQFGMNALVYALGWASLSSLFVVMWVSNAFLRSILIYLSVFVWAWIMLGMALDMDSFVKTLLAGSVLLILALVFTAKLRREFVANGVLLASFMPLIIVTVTLIGFALFVGDQMAAFYGLGLCVVFLGVLFWMYPRFQMEFDENLVLVAALSVAALCWDMWLQGYLPVPSVICLTMVLFVPDAVQNMLQNAAPIWKRLHIIVYLAFMLLPVALTIVFFDVLRAL